LLAWWENIAGHWEIIDSELRLPAAVRCAIRDEGGPMPATEPMDELLVA
jgi:hypothetical protein